mmetsp:Transcript_27221/g.56716  ORF Transcript_27221/g.56716 Transcript_27221/m.56716 type:complete len:161 (+) Transcript_27221:240-722(+)
MKEQYKLYQRAGIVTICVFRSTPQNITKYAADVDHQLLLALADDKGVAYKSYMLGTSGSGFLRDALKMIMNITKYVGHVHIGGMIKDARKVTQIPGDFMIDEDGIIVDVERGGAIPAERLEVFIPKDKRCRCKKKECVWSHCREEYDLMRKETENSIFLG